MTGVSWGSDVRDIVKKKLSSRIARRLKIRGFANEDFLKWKEKNPIRVSDFYAINQDRHRANKQLILLMSKDRENQSKETTAKATDRQGQSEDPAQPKP